MNNHLNNRSLSLDTSLSKLKNKFSQLKIGKLVIDNNAGKLDKDYKYTFIATLKDQPEFKIESKCKNYTQCKKQLIQKLSKFLSSHKNGEKNKYKKWSKVK